MHVQISDLRISKSAWLSKKNLIFSPQNLILVYNIEIFK